MRRRLRTFLSDAIDDLDLVDDLALAASEAMENAADHAYLVDGRAGAIRVAACLASACCGNPTVVIHISDDGTWQPQESSGYRGRGLVLIGELVAFHSIATGSDGTSITLCHPTARPDRSPVAA